MGMTKGTIKFGMGKKCYTLTHFEHEFSAKHLLMNPQNRKAKLEILNLTLSKIFIMLALFFDHLLWSIFQSSTNIL